MNFYADETYGERVAGVYDDWYSSVDAHAIDFLAQIAGEGRALELGIGTGRVALPLAAKNVNVSGIDAAQSMIDRLKAKAGSESIDVRLGSFADVSIDGEFDLVYVVFNTFFALGSQAEQSSMFSAMLQHTYRGRVVLLLRRLCLT